MTHDEKVLALLADGKPHTHHELYGLHVIAHSRVASLRAKGHTVEAWRDGDLYMYRLVASPLMPAPVADAGAGTSGGPPPADPRVDPRSAAPLPGQTSIDDELAEAAA